MAKWRDMAKYYFILERDGHGIMTTKTQCCIRATRTQFEPGNVQGRAAASGRLLRERAVEALRRIRRRARLRRDLQRLDEHLLHDIGARRADLEAEAAKPFWRR